MKNMMPESMLKIVYSFVIFMMVSLACLIATNTLSTQSIVIAMLAIVVIIGVIVMEVFHSRKEFRAIPQ